MKFDPYAFLADLPETAALPHANHAIRAIPERPNSTNSTNSTPSAQRSESERAAPVPPALPADSFPYGLAVNGNPRTWTGQIVSLDAWRRLTKWDRDGSTGQHWNGITRQWEAAPQSVDLGVTE